MGRTRKVNNRPKLDIRINRESVPLLVALIAVGSQPDLAVRTGETSYRTSQDMKVLLTLLFDFLDSLAQPHLLQKV